MIVNIAGINKVDLLYALWTNMSPSIPTIYASLLNNNTRDILFNRELAKLAVLDYIDYFQGRCIKLDLSKDDVDTFLYDRDAGYGAFQRIVSELISKQTHT